MTRIVTNLHLADQTALSQTCKAMRDATREARQADLAGKSTRPGRFSTDPFPTLYEHVQRGGRPRIRNMNLPNLLDACKTLSAGDGQLQSAARRRLRALVHLEFGTPIKLSEGSYFGERDADKVPHGVGVFYSIARASPDSVYFGDWRHGQRCGFGMQFYFIEHPMQWGRIDDPASDRYVTMSLRGGWYEGEWINDQYSGRGQLIRLGNIEREGLWKDGQPIASA